MRKSVDGAGKVFFAVPFFCFFLPLCVPLAAQQTVKNPSASELRSRVVAAAKQYVGVPYRYGGTNVSGMDCSGFIYTVAREAAGVQLPRTTTAMYSFCRIVPDKDKEIGDILFFKTVGSKISHAGFYIGNNQFIHAVSDAFVEKRVCRLRSIFAAGKKAFKRYKRNRSDTDRTHGRKPCRSARGPQRRGEESSCCSRKNSAHSKRRTQQESGTEYNRRFFF